MSESVETITNVQSNDKTENVEEYKMKCEHSEHINKNETNGPKIICNENEVDANSKYEQENMEFKDLEGCFNDEHNKLFENSNTNLPLFQKIKG